MLTATQPAYGYGVAYEYDEVGNRTSQLENGVPTGYTYNNVNELTETQSIGVDTDYIWDARGKLTGKTTITETEDDPEIDNWVYIYDLANRLTQVTKNGTTLGTYAYDANGIRAKKMENGATTHYLAMGHQVMYEKTGNIATRHIFAGTRRIAEVKNGVVSFFHNDHLGSPRVVTDENGATVTQGIATKPFGEPHATSALTSYMFTGKDLDDTGLYYFAARYYDPAVARFVTEDTWKGRLYQPTSQNRYVYVLNNPLRYVDPTGNKFIDALLEWWKAAGAERR